MKWIFRNALRDELDFQGMTVKELSAKSMVAKGALDSYLGKQASMPPADVAVRIAAALGVTVEYLVSGHGSQEKTPPFFSNPTKRLVLRIFDELAQDDQKFTLNFLKLLRKDREEKKDQTQNLSRNNLTQRH